MISIQELPPTTYKPHNYQEWAYDHLLSHEGAGLFMEMGLGKTVVTLSALSTMLAEGNIKRILIIAPKKVCESVWQQESRKWSHLRHLTFSKILGTERERRAALYRPADIYLINKENTAWLIALMQGRSRFDCLVIDESSSFKSEDSKRFRAVKSLLPALKRRIILTGTPRPNTVLDLWSQVFILDEGLRLGNSFTNFRDKYYVKKPYSDHVYESRLTDEDRELLGDDIYEREVSEKISDICISMQEKDYLTLPPKVESVIWLDFSPENREKYEDFESSQLLKLPNDEDLTVVNAAALTNKLLQFTNGAVYDEEKIPHTVHDEKLERLQDIVEEAGGKPVLIFYTFRHDIERIIKALKHYKVTQLKDDKDVQDWNAGKIEILLAHPASAGHGLNLQGAGSHVVWFGLNWNLEWVLQGNKRIHRQGRVEPVFIHYILIRDTMDVAVYDSLNSKESKQTALMDAVSARRKKYLTLQKRI